MFQITNLNGKKIFSLEEAQNILPLVYRLTDESNKEVKYLMGCIEALQDRHAETTLDLQTRINLIIDKWQNKLTRLGIKPKGLWLADFDNGDGYFCWKFPETKILFRHGYQDGFTGRTLLNHKDQNESRDLPN